MESQPNAIRTSIHTGNGHVLEVVREAHEELRHLLQQRAEVMRRIGTIKQTIAGLANLYGDEVLSEELLELIDRKSSGRQSGFTKACRMILMDANRSLSARGVCDQIQEKMPAHAVAAQRSHGLGYYGAESIGGLWRGQGCGSRKWTPRLAMGR